MEGKEQKELGQENTNMLGGLGSRTPSLGTEQNKHSKALVILH